MDYTKCTYQLPEQWEEILIIGEGKVGVKDSASDSHCCGVPIPTIGYRGYEDDANAFIIKINNLEKFTLIVAQSNSVNSSNSPQIQISKGRLDSSKLLAIKYQGVNNTALSKITALIKTKEKIDTNYSINWSNQYKWSSSANSSAIDGLQWTSSNPSTGSQAYIKLTFSGINKITFNYDVSSYQGSNFLCFSDIDDNNYTQTWAAYYTSGVDTGTYTVGCDSGTHYIYIAYDRKSSTSSGRNNAIVYISEIY